MTMSLILILVQLNNCGVVCDSVLRKSIAVMVACLRQLCLDTNVGWDFCLF